MAQPAEFTRAPERPAPRRDPRGVQRWIVAAALLLAALLGSYAPVLRGLLHEWQRDPDYSAGALAPLAALGLAWRDRRALAAGGARAGWVAGVALLIAAQALRLAGVIWLYESLERYAFWASLVGVLWLVCGGRVVWRARWLLALLLLMVPLPGQAHNLVSGRLQTIAAAGTPVVLELLGLAVSRAGHVLVINDRVEIGVVEACSGLRMLTAFVLVAALFAFMIERPRWHKALLVLSSVPIAVFCNLVRLVATALLYLLISAEFGERFFHDFAGLTMMPLAVAVLLAESALLARLVRPAPAPVAQPALLSAE
jgi:exosortase